MIVTRSMAKKDNAENIRSNKVASSQAHYKAHSTDAVVPGDMARGAIDNHASTRSEVAKSNSALHHTIPRKDKSAQSYPRTNVPSSRTTPHHDSQKSTRTRKLSRSTQATVKKRGLKSKKDSDDSIVNSSIMSSTVVGSGENESNNTRRPSTRGVKRKSDDEENAPKFERGPRVNTRRIRRRLEMQTDEKETRNRRADAVIEAPGPSRRVRRRALEGSDRQGEGEGKSPPASGILTESPQETLVNDESNSQNTCGPGSDEESTLPSSLPLNGDLVSKRSSTGGLSRGRHMSAESVPSAIWSERGSTEPRSPSTGSLLTPPPYIKQEEEEIVLTNRNIDMTIPLDSRGTEEDLADMVIAELPQLQDEEPEDEQLIKNNEDDPVTADRYRSLAPEPDQGLINAIRSGKISGLASPPPSIHEAS
ncbi:hypothetical protein ACEPAH_9597 [Sanghuangporus vaninii]